MDFVAISLLNGISFGMVLFLLTVGLSLTLGLMGILNLAHGALFMIGSFVGWTVAVQLGLSYWLALLAGTIAAGLVGLAIQQGFLRRLYKLINEQVLLTIGFIYILMNAGLWIWGGRGRLPYFADLFSGSLPVFDFEYPIHRIFTIGIGLLLVLVLWWLQEKTRFGAIVRAGMDDRETVTGLGINLGRVTYLVFFFGALLAGFAGVISSQMMGAYLGMSWDILLLALIVLVVGGMGSIQGALVGAILIGLADAFGRALFPDLAMFLMYLVMIVILLVKPAGLLPKIFPSGESSATPSLIQVERLTYAEKRRVIRFAPYIVVGIILIAVPPFLPTYLQGMMSKILIFALFAISLDLIWGYTGLFSLGHAAFFGAAGYTTVILVNHYGASNFWQTAPASIFIATLFAAIFGYIALRVKGLFFLMVTFAIGQLLFCFAWEQYHITGGAFGLSFQPQDLVIPGFSYSVISIYYFILLFFFICFFLLYRIVNSPFGHVLRGIREDELRMRALGYNTWLYKYIAFIIAGLFAGVAGVLFAHWNQLLTPYQLGITTSTYALLCLIIGGAGTLCGPFVGAILVVGMEYGISLLYPERWPLILGVLFVITVMFLRGGVYPRLVNLWRKVGGYSIGSVKN